MCDQMEFNIISLLSTQLPSQQRKEYNITIIVLLSSTFSSSRSKLNIYASFFRG